MSQRKTTSTEYGFFDAEEYNDADNARIEELKFLIETGEDDAARKLGRTLSSNSFIESVVVDQSQRILLVRAHGGLIGVFDLTIKHYDSGGCEGADDRELLLRSNEGSWHLDGYSLDWKGPLSMPNAIQERLHNNHSTVERSTRSYYGGL